MQYFSEMESLVARDPVTSWMLRAQSICLVSCRVHVGNNRPVVVRYRPCPPTDRDSVCLVEEDGQKLVRAVRSGVTILEFFFFQVFDYLSSQVRASRPNSSQQRT